MQAGWSMVLDELQKTHWIMFPKSGNLIQPGGGLLAAAEDGSDTTEGGGKETLLAELYY